MSDMTPEEIANETKSVPTPTPEENKAVDTEKTLEAEAKVEEGK